MSSSSYVLAEYGGDTRKIQGEWSKQSYSKLLKEVKSKFGITDMIDIQVLDKKNNKYFTIDSGEMKEIPKGGQIRIVKRKGGNYNKTSGGHGKSGGYNKSKGGGKGGKAPMKPPGVPPASKADDAKRNSWKSGSKVEIYSEGQRKWQKGEITKIFNDNEGEWLVIKYAGFRTKEIQRFSNYIRPIQKGGDKGKGQTKGGKDIYKKADKKGDDKGKKGKDDKKKEKKEKKPKITTKSKFRKKERFTSITQIAENEIYIKGNKSHIKKYIDRACLLLRGTDAGTEPPKDIGIPAAGSGASSEEHSGDSEDDEVVLLDPKDDVLSKKPSKKYNVIHLFGTGRSMGPVVQTAEIVKRIVSNLYQVSSLEAIEIREIWAPTEQGLKEVETIRQIPQLKITLATEPSSLDKESVGYQEPIASDDFASTIEYHYPEENEKGGKRGRGGKTRGRGRGRGHRGKGKGGSSSGGRGRGRGRGGRGRGY